MSWLGWVKQLLTSAPTAEPDPAWVSTAAIYPLLVSPAVWIHRRVESVEFVDDRLVRRRVSLDFTVPDIVGREAPLDCSQLRYLPLTLLRKGPLRNFDLDTASGEPIPVLTKAQNEVVVAQSLTSIGETVAGIALPPDIRERLFHVVADSPELADADVARWRSLRQRPGTEGAIWKTLTEDEAFMDYARALASSFVLLIVLPPMPGVRRVIKLGYDEEPASEPRIWKRVASSFGWRRTTFAFEASAASLCASYHFEVGAPSDLEISSARIDINPAVPDPTTDPAPGSRAHIYVSGVAPGADATVVVDMHARRSGLLRASLFVSAVSSVLLLGGYLQLDSVADPDQTQMASGLLLLIPTFLAAYIVRPGEHQLASALLLGVRLLVVLSALAAIFAAGLLATGLDKSAHFDRLWFATFASSAICTLGLIVSYKRPFATSPP